MSAVHEGALAIYTRWGSIGLSYSFFQTLPSNIHLGVESRSNAEAKLRNQNPKAKVQQLKTHGYLNPFGAHKVAQRTSGTWTYYKVTESFFSRSGEGGEWRETGGGGSAEESERRVQGAAGGERDGRGGSGGQGLGRVGRAREEGARGKVGEGARRQRGTGGGARGRASVRAGQGACTDCSHVSIAPTACTKGRAGLATSIVMTNTVGTWPGLVWPGLVWAAVDG